MLIGWCRYGALRAHISSGSPRSVGRALATNPFAPRVPCHRVLPATLFAGGFRGNPPATSKGNGEGEKCEGNGEGEKGEGNGEGEGEKGEGNEGEKGGEEIKWNWHDSVKVQGADAVRREKVRMLKQG